MYTLFVFQVWCTISNIHFGRSPINTARFISAAATRVQWRHCVRSDFAQRKKGTARFKQFRMKNDLSFYDLEAFCQQSPTKLPQVSLIWHFYVQSPGKHGPSVERSDHLKKCTGQSPISLDLQQSSSCKKKEKLSSTCHMQSRYTADKAWMKTADCFQKAWKKRLPQICTLRDKK